MKSAGDEYSFCLVLINGKTGHSREYATKLALNMTRAMKFYLENKDGLYCCHCGELVLDHLVTHLKMKEKDED